MLCSIRDPDPLGLDGVIPVHQLQSLHHCYCYYYFYLCTVFPALNYSAPICLPWISTCMHKIGCEHCLWCIKGLREQFSAWVPIYRSFGPSEFFYYTVCVHYCELTSHHYGVTSGVSLHSSN